MSERTRRDFIRTGAAGAAALALFRSRLWLSAGYPKSLDFRHLWPNSVGFLEHNTAFLVDFTGDKIPAAQELKRRYPDRLVLMQVNDERNGIWGSWHVVPREFAAKEGLHCDPAVFPMPEFRGCGLLGQRTTLSADFPAESEQCELSVPDASAFATQVYGHNLLRDVLVYRVVNGQPDWLHSEYASVARADARSNALVVKRWPKDAVGEWHAYRAGEACVTPSVGSIYAMNGKWIKTWIPNLTRFCPRDPATGRDAVTWWARHFARLWHTRIAAAEPHPDGDEFDGLAESPWSDCDNDGTIDGCEVGGVNYWRLGRDDFFRKLRAGDGFAGLGEALVLADASNVWGARRPEVLNGAENEEFPSFLGPDYFPSGTDLYQVWCAHAAKPSCSYLQGRFNWLGKPLGPPVRLTEHLGPDLLAGADWRNGWESLEGGNRLPHAKSRTTGLADPTAFQLTVTDVSANGQPPLRGLKAAARVVLQGPECGELLRPDREYAVTFEVQGQPPTGADGERRPAEPWSWIGVCLRTGDQNGLVQSIVVGQQPRRVALTLRPQAAGKGRVAFHVGAQPGQILVRDLSVREGCAEVFARRFEGGLVLANGSAVSAVTFDLAALDPGRKHRRFRGAQAPDVNSGQPVGQSFTLPPQDGILLKAEGP